MRITLGLVLVVAAVLKVGWDASTPTQSRQGLLQSRPVLVAAAAVECVLGAALIAGLWPSVTGPMAIALFALFAGVAGVEALHHARSCGCFGAVRVPPAYTAIFDGMAVGLLALMPAAPPDLRSRSPWARPAVIAAILSFSSLATLATIELRGRPLRAATVIAGRADAPVDGEFGPTGSLAVLEPGQWAGKTFALSAHIEGGPTLLHGRWVVLLVHDDCDHCAAAVPRFIAAAAADRDSWATRLAIVEMPPFADASDPPPWFPLPASVVSGRLDASHDWFATTPVAVVVEDGVVTKAAEGDAAGDPAAFFPRIP